MKCVGLWKGRVKERIWRGPTNNKGPLKSYMVTYFCGNFLKYIYMSKKCKWGYHTMGRRYLLEIICYHTKHQCQEWVTFCWIVGQRDLIYSPKLSQAVSKVIGCSPQTGAKALLLKTLITSLNTEKLSLYQLETLCLLTKINDAWRYFSCYCQYHPVTNLWPIL